MILGNIRNLEQERKFLSKPLIQGLEYIKNTDFSKLPDGRYEINGRALFAIVQEYQTSPKENCEAETHRKYVDIQFLAQGVEIIGYGLTGPGSEVLQDLGDEKDAILYKTVQNEIDLVFTAGMYAVFFPTDIHRPCCNVTNRSKVKKVVVKVSVESL